MNIDFRFTMLPVGAKMKKKENKGIIKNKKRERRGRNGDNEASVGRDEKGE